DGRPACWIAATAGTSAPGVPDPPAAGGGALSHASPPAGFSKAPRNGPGSWAGRLEFPNNETRSRADGTGRSLDAGLHLRRDARLGFHRHHTTTPDHTPADGPHLGE